MVKEIEIDGKIVKFKSSAAIHRLYRIKFRRDIMRDMADIDKAIKSGDTMPLKMLDVFEDVAYLMAKHADNSIPDDVGEWLDSFETFSVYEVFPQIMELWNLDNKTLETPKKK